MDDEFTHTAPPLQTTMGGERVSYGNSGVREGCDNPGGLWVEGMCVFRGSPVNPDTQHYIITRQNTYRLYTTPNEKTEQTGLRWCSHAVFGYYQLFSRIFV